MRIINICLKVSVNAGDCSEQLFFFLLRLTSLAREACYVMIILYRVSNAIFLVLILNVCA